MVWEKMAKKKKCVIPVKNRDDLCCARAIVTMKGQADNEMMDNGKISAKGFAFKKDWPSCWTEGQGLLKGCAVTQSSKSFKSSWGHRDNNCLW